MVCVTPGTLSKSDSTHQKQPPAKVATAIPGGTCVCAKRNGAKSASRKAIEIRRIGSLHRRVAWYVVRGERGLRIHIARIHTVPPPRPPRRAARVAVHGRAEPRAHFVREDMLAPEARDAIVEP